MEINAIILAAGKGTRMKSALPKVMHELSGIPMIEHIVRTVKEANVSNIYLVVGHGAEKVKEHFKEDKTVYFVEQKEQLGTAHAVKQAKSFLDGKEGQTIILTGDTPLITVETIKRTIAEAQKGESAVLTTIQEDPFGYGRIVRNKEGFVEAIVEEKDATEKQKEIKEVNTGIFSVENRLLFNAIEKIGNNNSQGEYYLTDIVGALAEDGYKMSSATTTNPDEVLGVNDRYQLAELEEKHQKQLKKKIMQSGVCIKNPDTVYIEVDVEVKEDVVIEGSVALKGKTVIGKGSVVGKGSEISDSTIGENVTILNSFIEEAVVKNDAKVGPYAHLRPAAVIGEKAKIGNFVEVKKSDIGEGTKISHLSYIGDAEIGKNVNIGCGAITVNYDGKNKFKTIIKDDAFVGCNVNMVAPVTIDENALLAAGSTITKNVPPRALGIARNRQENKEGFVK